MEKKRQINTKYGIDKKSNNSLSMQTQMILILLW